MMTRILTISCILLAIATFAAMTINHDVTVQSTAPQLINPGDEFMVRVSIDKGALKKGAVLQQIIPDGFSASEIESEGAQFYFENQMVRFVWDNIPTKSMLVVSYKLKASETLNGMKKIQGTFIYAQNNNTAQINLPTNLIYVSDDLSISSTTLLSEDAGSFQMKRTIIPGKGDMANGYRIILDVIQQNETGFASWTDQIPTGYTIEVNAANNAAFHMDDNLVKFSWEEIPTDQAWSFSYTIYPPSGTSATENPDLLGIMVYGSAESIKTCIPSMDKYSAKHESPVAVNNDADISTGVSTLFVEESAEKLDIMKEPEASANVIIESDVTEAISGEVIESDITEVKAAAIIESDVTDVSANLITENDIPESKSQTIMPMVQRGIYYRVQIAATKRSPTRDSEFFQSRYNITRQVDMAEEDGWKKYCVGTFARMEPANSFVLETRSNIPDAFIVAYRDGVRIPVDEAMETMSISMR